MSRRLLSGLLCLALVLGLLPPGLVQPARAASWADPYGEKLVEWGVMRGDISGNLQLDRPITRAELVTMINRAYGYTKTGATPFTDVPFTKWYAEDIGIAYNAGYFKGTSATTASPESSVTREQAAVFLARNLMFQETVGESLGFSDSRDLNDWSRGLIGAAVQEGMLNGYKDGSFRPKNNITRGEVAAMLVKAIGTPVRGSGDQSLGHVYGNVTLTKSNTNLRNTTIAGNLYISGGIDLGHVLLENVTVLGRIVVSGAGEGVAGQESVVLRNVEADELVIDSLRSPFITVKAQGVTDIPQVSVRTNAYVDDSSWEGYGLTKIELDGAPGTKLQLAGNIKEVVNLTPGSDLQVVKGSAEKVTMDEYATGSKLLVDTGARVDELNLDVATEVTGKGDIKDLNVAAGGCTVEQLPDKVVIRPGITADVDGETMGSSEAAELSAEPRLLAGYPRMQNIAPTQAEGVYSGNKPGTIYWAISAVADGSVSEEDLISNPTYGGNIFEEQAGSIDVARGSTEYLARVQNLEPDGSYYVAAILVDGRGKRSPVKVASFSTPDDTVPAFVKDPTMTKVTTDTAQATVMANKSCLLYWALLPQGAQAPTPQEFKTGSLGGNYGYGSLSVLKNAEISVTVNRQKLREKASYDLFLWLTDHNGAQSMAAPFRITFTTPDETPPVVTGPVQMPPYGADTANATFSMNEAPATLFWAVVPEGDTTFIAPGDTAEETAEIMADLRTKIRVENAGDSATASGSTAVQNAYTDTAIRIAGLVTAQTNTNNYTMYYIGKDAAGNYSERVGSISIKTLDTKWPEVSINFLETVEGRPRASSDIQLVFSEVVKGGGKEGGLTFLDYYQAVLDNAGNPTLLKEAKNRLAAELAKHIKMYSVPRSGQPVELEPKGDNQTDDNWVIDFHNARVELDNGRMIITLPNEENLDNSALQMDSGATYYFHLREVYDNAFQPNGVMDDPNGNYRLDNFTTIYGQVELARNTSVTSIPATDPNYPNIRLDMCVDVKPESTSKMPPSEYWDMIIWSDVGVDVKIYFQKDGGNWELLNSVTDIPIEPAGIGLGTRAEVNSASHRIQPVYDSLEEEHTYRYGIHITRVGNIKETDETQEPQDWSELVTMKFSLVAGTQGDIQNLSRNVPGNYEQFVNVDKTATEIGIEYLQTGTRRILEYPRQFTDTRVPEFSSGMPTFEAGSGAINMRMGLQRPGKVYWVAAEEGTIVTNINDSTPISKANDGRDGSTLTGKSYIPTSGSDRGANAKDIHFMSGGGTDAAGNFIPGEYSAPYWRDIYTGAETYRNNAEIKTGVKELSGAVEDVPITGLKPKTWYYIYIVRQGGGDPNHIVEIYRVETQEVSTPTLDMRPSGTTGVTMTPNDTNCRLYYALVEWNSLPTWFLEEYEWKEGGGKYTPATPPAAKPAEAMTVLEAMIQRVNDGTGRTYFDVYGGETNINLKDRVKSYISSPTNDQVGYIPILRRNTEDDSKTEDFSNEMTSQTSEYVVLACARNTYGVDVGESYGFAASRGLYRPDPVPPEYNGEMPLYQIAPTGVYQEATGGTAISGWQNRNNIAGFYFNGKVTLQFDKEVYYARQTGGDRVRLQVVNLPRNKVTDPSKQISILDVISGTGASKFYIAPVDEGDGATDSFTLSFRRLYNGETLTLRSIGNSNNQSNVNTKTLTLRFDSTLRNTDYGGFLTMWQPGFRVTWQ